MKRYIYYTALLITVFTLFSCKPGAKAKIIRKKIGDYFIEAAYIKDSQIDGIARYYDVKNRLVSIVGYKNGLKFGPAINFYESGMKRDSTFYRDGLIHGRAFVFDRLGNITKIADNYYGIPVGDNITYFDGKPKEYEFVDFHSDLLVACIYDSAGKCELGKFNLEPITNIIDTDSGETKLSVFFYLPQPPDLTTTFSLGLLNERNIKISETPIPVNSRSFIDTTLLFPGKGEQYFLSAHIQNLSGSINKVVIYKIAW